MHDFIPKLSVKRRRLIPRRPHPDLEFLFRRQWDQPGLGADGSDDGMDLDARDPASQALPWIGFGVVPLLPENLDAAPASQTAVVSRLAFNPAREQTRPSTPTPC